MVGHILREAQNFKRQIASLRVVAPTYPDYFVEEYEGALWATCMVEFSYENQLYSRHHVQTIVPCSYAGRQELVKRLLEEAQKTKEFAKPCLLDELLYTPNAKANMTEGNKDLLNMLWQEHHRADARYLCQVLTDAGYTLTTLGAEVLWKEYSELTAAAGWLAMPDDPQILLQRILPFVERALRTLHENPPRD